MNAKHAFCIFFGLAAACSGDFSTHPGTQRLVVDIITPDGQPPEKTIGSQQTPLALQIGVPITFKVKVTAVLPDGTRDTTFTRFVRVSSKPGAVAPLGGPGTDGRNVLLNGGISEPVDVTVTNAFGTTYIVADDLGYIPADPLANPPPKCANGIDDNNNGLIDFPADPGCAYANDDSEDGGSFDEGVSPPIFFRLPRIADARGLNCDAKNVCSGGGATPYPKDQLLLDTGWHDVTSPKHPKGPGFDFDTVVIRVSADGFYASDLSDSHRSGPPPAAATGFNSLFAYNFNAPPKMRVCDRIKSLAGTAAEFFGFTQLSYPTWELEEWDPSKRDCLVPEPTSMRPGDVNDTSNLLRLTASLVRVETAGTSTSLGALMGPGDVKPTPNDGKICGAPTATLKDCYVAGADASNCDFNHDNKIDFTLGSEEGRCSNDCDNLVINPTGCTEYSNFKARSNFKLIVVDENNQIAAIQANASAAAGFDVLANKGKKIRSFTGTLTFFSGGSQFTIEARCNDDIVVDVGAKPFDSGKACVLPRTFLELNPQ
jgi:hypothetical protein